MRCVDAPQIATRTRQPQSQHTPSQGRRQAEQWLEVKRLCFSQFVNPTRRFGLQIVVVLVQLRGSAKQRRAEVRIEGFEQRQEFMANAIAREVGGFVRAVVAKLQLIPRAMVEHFRARDGQHRTHEPKSRLKLNFRVNAVQTGGARPAQQPHQEGFDLIVAGVSRHNDARLTFGGGALQKIVAQATRCRFQIFLFVFGASGDVLARRKHGHIELSGNLAHKRFISVGFCAAQLMIQMRDKQRRGFFPTRQRIQQRRRIGSARHGHQHRLVFGNIKLAQTSAQFFFQFRQFMRLLTTCLLLLLLATASAQPKRDAVSATATMPRSRDQIQSRAEFDQLARIYYQGRFYALPHLMFVIDRAAQGKVYYVNSKRYSFHKDFVNANYLTLERGQEFFKHNYLESKRRFLLGTIAWQTKANQFTFEFWEGDLLTAELLGEAQQKLSASFFVPLHFKPNSKLQDSIAAQIKGLPILRAADLGEAKDYLPLHQAKAVGLLRIVDKLTDDIILDRNEIVIFREAPLTLTPVSGIITTNFSTPLAHVNLLAAGWGVPNAYVKNADEIFKALVGKFVYFEAREDGFVLRAAETKETAEAGRKLAERSDLLTPEADLEFKQLTELKAQRMKHSQRFGAKAANLGEVLHAVQLGKIPGVIVPGGFSIPFVFYEEFLQANKLDEEIVTLLGNDRFNHDAAYRKQRLAELRRSIQAGKHTAEFQKLLRAKVRAVFGSLQQKGVFARSSTNSEDLPNFSGAGLYTSVPNVKSDAALEEAIKTVWASLWNYEAYEARESAGINHSAVYASVLVQEAINADAAGVMITTNPFDAEDQGAIYLNAKRGLGIRVVEGKRVAEQIIYAPRSGAIKVLTRSDDDTMLKFDAQGGVREIKIETQRAVLTNDLVKRLARAAQQIKRTFSGRDQDIEWLTVGQQIYIVQARPYVRAR